MHDQAKDSLSKLYQSTSRPFTSMHRIQTLLNYPTPIYSIKELSEMVFKNILGFVQHPRLLMHPKTLCSTRMWNSLSFHFIIQITISYICLIINNSKLICTGLAHCQCIAPGFIKHVSFTGGTRQLHLERKKWFPYWNPKIWHYINLYHMPRLSTTYRG